MKKGKIILVTGGARSGKSRLAESLLVNCQEKFYIATCPVIDEEMSLRIARHRNDREKANWQTVEEEQDLTGALQAAIAFGAEGILVDCLTLWVNNLLYYGKVKSEDEIVEKAEEVLQKLSDFTGTVVFVINEVGLGIVPESPGVRLFRDLSGRCAQKFAEKADEVYFCLAGIGQKIK